MENEKKNRCVFFFFFDFLATRNKGKKMCSAEIVFGLLPNCIVKKQNRIFFFFFYCKPCNCIARERAGKKIVVKIVLQYHFCIAERKA